MRAVEASSKNEAVIQQAQNEVRSAQASIKFLEDELAKLQVGGASGSPMRESASSQSRISAGGQGGYGGQQPYNTGQQRQYPPGAMSPSRSGPGLSSELGQMALSPSPSRRNDLDRPLPPPPPGEVTPAGQSDGPKLKNYTQLGESPE